MEWRVRRVESGEWQVRWKEWRMMDGVEDGGRSGSAVEEGWRMLGMVG